jgi:uncharacterized membrane protein
MNEYNTQEGAVVNSEKNTYKEVLIERLGRGKYLHAIIPIMDKSGKVVHRVVKPLMVELRKRDIVQILVGSTILAIPVGFTEETWNLGQRLPMTNILLLALFSILFIALFVYMNFYRHYFREHVAAYIKRVISIYLLSLIVVGLLMTVILQCPWGVDNLLAIKRIVIVSFPASLSATLTDAIK